MQYLVFNSFNKSAGTFLMQALNHFQPYFIFVDKDGIDYMDRTLVTRIAIPSLIGAEGVNTVTVIRDPYECISDLFASSGIVVDGLRDKTIKDFADEWLSFTENAKNSIKKKNVYLVDYKKAIKTPATVCKEIFDKFGMQYDDGKIAYTDKELITVVNNYLDFKVEKNPLKNSIMRHLKETEFMEDYYEEYKNIEEKL